MKINFNSDGDLPLNKLLKSHLMTIDYIEEHVCNRCHDLLTMGYLLKNTAILNAKEATFRCLLMDISKNVALKRLNNSVTCDRGVLQIWILAQIKYQLK